MISAKLIIFLVIEYIAFMGVAVFERNYPLATYWFGAIILNIAVLIMAVPK